MILYIENTTVYTQKLLELVNKFSKVAEFKINKKFVAFLYTNNEQSEIESKKKSCLKSHQK